METRRDVFQAIADPTRRAILDLVALQAMTAGAIADQFDSSRQTISRHIQILYECELLNQAQYGREIYYQFKPRKMKEVAEWLEPYRKMWEARMDSIGELLDEMETKKSKPKK